MLRIMKAAPTMRMKSWMTPRQWLVAAGLLGLVIAAIAALMITGNSASQPQGRPRRTPLVSERLLQTARSVSSLASTREEQRYAQQALRLADHAVDLAFADALRDAAENPPQPTEAVRQLYARIAKAEQLLKADQNNVERLKKQLATATSGRERLQQEFDLAQAQLELDQDELEDAREDLMRSGADPQSRIRRQFERHKATQHEYEANHQPASTSNEPYQFSGSFVSQLRDWYQLQGKAARLKAARDEALETGGSLSQQHNFLEQRVRAAEDNPPQAPGSGSESSAQAGSKADTTQAIESLHRRAGDQRVLASLDKRIQDAHELSDTYGNWVSLLRARQTMAVHGMIRSAVWILLIVLVLYLAARAVDRLVPDVARERTRMRTLRAVIRFGVQAVGVLLILFVVFGTPSQISTILGLAGAGLTVALKDFIVAFFGWFVLMGRNGIRVGDWVEINGVVGEVIEINLLRTILLETGNWTDTGHPTGRKVAFMNGYAIEGHFFNFSTTGQWLWDELQITVPSHEDPYPIIAAVQSIVAGETESNTRMAEQEWQRAAGRYAVVQSVSAAPAVYVRPTGSGVEVHVRYVSRASERYAMRARLYQALLALLHRHNAQRSEPASAPAIG